jgi:hypothetical protein
MFCRQALAVAAAFVVLAATPASHAAAAEKVLFEFDYTTGFNPVSGLIFDAKGNLYGTVPDSGGTNYGGNVFELSPAPDGTWTEQILYTFGSSPTDGNTPESGLIMDAAGNLYGTTYFGGTGSCTDGPYTGCGTVFELVPGSNGQWAEKILYSFGAAPDGNYPYANLIMDAAGNLYGTTALGGETTCKYGCGTVFELMPGANGQWTENLLYTFKGYWDGYNPGDLAFDAAGTLYGSTPRGGALLGDCNRCGTIFTLTPGKDGKWNKKVLHTFSGPDGNEPGTPLIFDAHGNMYGTTYLGGRTSTCNTFYGRYGCGVVFELTPHANGQWTEKVLRSFFDERSPGGGVIMDARGNLYATTTYAGDRFNSHLGTVFELSPAGNGGWTQTILHEFPEVDGDGEMPLSNLVFDSSGNLYGTTEYGGSSGCPFNNQTCGTVFEVTP